MEGHSKEKLKENKPNSKGKAVLNKDGTKMLSLTDSGIASLDGRTSHVARFRRQRVNKQSVILKPVKQRKCEINKKPATNNDASVDPLPAMQTEEDVICALDPRNNPYETGSANGQIPEIVAEPVMNAAHILGGIWITIATLLLLYQTSIPYFVVMGFLYAIQLLKVDAHTNQGNDRDQTGNTDEIHASDDVGIIEGIVVEQGNPCTVEAVPYQEEPWIQEDENDTEQGYVEYQNYLLRERIQALARRSGLNQQAYLDIHASRFEYHDHYRDRNLDPSGRACRDNESQTS